MIYLDTHVILWLFEGKIKLLSEYAKQQIRQQDLYISPIVRLELQFLYEIKKITIRPQKICSELHKDIDLTVCKKNFMQIIEESEKHSWTRDPFDRIIVAHAALNSNPLITKDEVIQKHYKFALW